MNDITPLEGASGAPAQRASQGTMVEQARAIAEVRAAVMIAMERPRDRTSAIAEMREVCSIPEMAERAFFRVPRGGQTVNGESIHLARELARCWGNLTYGVKELSRDDVRGQSELLAYAWDMQTNARSEITFMVPHRKDARGGGRALTTTQEVYENNASFAGRRLRETIFAVLPVWFREEAAAICHRTLQHGGGKPLAQRRTDCLLAFEALGVTKAQIEKRQGRKVDALVAEDLAQLGVVLKSIQRGEVQRDEEFPRDELAVLAAGADPLEQASAGKAAPATGTATARPPAKLTVMDATATAVKVAPAEWLRECLQALALIGAEGAAGWAKDMVPHIAAARAAGLNDEAERVLDRVAELRGMLPPAVTDGDGGGR